MNWPVLGIRHHGPGCARSLLAALEELKPRVLVLEAPADAESVIEQAGLDGMKPPVALLLYPPDRPRDGVYYPLAEFSPEWQAIRWALRNGVGVRFMDLPQSSQLKEKEKSAEEVVEPSWRTDPIAILAEAAGFVDHELWWEEQVERRADATGLFQAILEAMSAVREEYPEVGPRDRLREAHMRQVLRQVVKEFASVGSAGASPSQPNMPARPTVAVVCGAYHAPALTAEAVRKFPAKEDAAMLKGLPKTKTIATWIPWSYSRLSYRSGYGAGVASPGWYSQIWHTPDAAPQHWIVRAARLLRDADLDASSANVIESLRLADALAALRDLRSPGLPELTESIRTVFCHGGDSPLQLIHDRLEVGDLVGEVPEEAANVPLARDLEKQTKSLRLKRSSETRLLDLDLRKENDLARSALFHRLRLLDIAWATPQNQSSDSSTFHEHWQLAWNPELAVQTIDANLWGATVELAAANRAIDQAGRSSDVSLLATLLHRALLAQIQDAVDPILARLQAQAAVAADVQTLMQSLPELANVARYSDVRRTRAANVLPILEGLFARIVAGLPAACSSLDDDAARRTAANLDKVEQSLRTVQRDDLRSEWMLLLHRLVESRSHGLVRGWSARLLLDQSQLDDEQLHRMARLALSPSVDPADAAHWLAGLLHGSGMALLHQEELWRILDRWLAELGDQAFQGMLPLIRRAFADFTGPERRAMGEKVKRLGQSVAAAKPVETRAETIDVSRAEMVLPVLRKILGVE